jgi:heme oxygenase
MSATVSTPVGFAAQLRAGTSGAHERAERAGFVGRLLAGTLPASAYARLLVQLRAVYGALEDEQERWRHDPVGGGFVDDRLRRCAAIDEDLAWFFRHGVRTDASMAPATIAYVDRIREASRRDVGGFVAHHYTRYLGDLSGGQHLGRVVERTYGGGASMARFDTIDDPRGYKQQYRARLDAAPWDRVRRTAVIEEVRAAYTLNTQLFADLVAELEGGAA